MSPEPDRTRPPVIRPTRSRSARCTGPPSCCRSPPSAHVALIPQLLGWPSRAARRRAAQGLRGRAARGDARRPARASLRDAVRSPASARGGWRRRPPPAIAVPARGADRAAAGRRAARRPSGCWPGSALLVAADRGGSTARARRDDATLADALALGLAQACALLPGVSRLGRRRRRARCAASTARRRLTSARRAGAAGDRRRDRAEGRGAWRAAACRAGAARGVRGRDRRRRWPPRWLGRGRCGGDRRGAARGRARGAGGPRAAPSATIATHERRLRRRRRRHRPGRRGRRRAGRRPAHDRDGPAVARRSCPAATTPPCCAVTDELGIAHRHRRRRLQARRRRAGRPAGDGRHRLRGDERQRPHLRRRRADRAASTTSPSRRPTRSALARDRPGPEGRRRGGRLRDPGRRAGGAARADPRPSLTAAASTSARRRSAPSRSTRSSPATRSPPGDALIGVPSSGLHSNGYTLARRALQEQGGLGLDDTPAELGGASVADALLEPTVIYVRAVLELLRSGVAVRGLAHITGGGLTNILRLGGSATRSRSRCRSRRSSTWSRGSAPSRPPRCGRSSTWAAASSRSCPRPNADDAAAILAGHHPGARRIGTVTDQVGTVTVPKLSLTFPLR